MPVRFEIIVCLSFSSHVTCREPRNGSALNLVLENFAKICGHTPILAKVGKIMGPLHGDLGKYFGQKTIIDESLL